MGGSISVKSQENIGSTFKITIFDVKFAVQLSEIEDRVKINLQSVRFNGETILAIDDIKSNREMIRTFLDRVNLKVIEAINGEEGVQMAKKNRPDVY